MRTLYKDDQGISIMDARRPAAEELKGFTPEYQSRILYGIPGSEDINLPHITWRDMPDRKSEGEFPGCDNCAWILSPEDEQRYLDLEAERASAEQTKKDAARAISDDKRKTLIAKAIAEGKPQMIRRYVTEECTENLPDCSFDSCVELIDAQGKISKQYSHCH
jgi:hypothetical protein